MTMARNFLKPNVARNQLVRFSHDDGGIPGAVSKISKIKNVFAVLSCLYERCHYIMCEVPILLNAV